MRSHILTYVSVLFLASCGARNEQPQEVWWLFDKVDAANPCLLPGESSFVCPVRGDTVLWEIKDVFNPAAVVVNDSLYLIFRAEDSVGKYAGTSRLGLAKSADGLHFVKEPEPVFFPEHDAFAVYEWEGGVEDPRIVTSPDGGFVMTYTAYDGQVARLLVATSPDLRNWTKHGLAFGEGTYRDLWGKSGAIVTRIEGDQLVAATVNGRYWMYFGDKNIHLASSEDLVNWEIVEEAPGTPAVILPYRPGYFDSDLVEPGPPAMMTDDGILLIYNGRNYGPERIASIPEGTYSAGQALFSLENPAQLIARTDTALFRPEASYEIEGQVNRVVFLEGLARLKGEWFLYYGTADSKIAVAIRN